MAMGQSSQEYYPQEASENDPRMAALRALSRSASTDQERADVNELNQLMTSPRSSAHNSRTSSPVRRSSIHSRTSSPVKVPPPRSSTPETYTEDIAMEEVKLRHHIENDDSSTYFINDVESERVLSPGAGLWATLKGVICHDEASAQLCHFVMGLLTVAAFVFGVLLMFSWGDDANLDAACRNNCTAEELSYITMKVHTMTDAAYDIRSNQIYQLLLSSKLSIRSDLETQGIPQQRALRYVTYLTQDVDLWDIAEERHLLQLYGLACGTNYTVFSTNSI